MSRKYIIILGIAVLLVVLTQIASGPLNRQEQGLLDYRFHLRGELSADTNVVILYFDNDDIGSLEVGGTLKRSYYALLINMLTRSGVAAIGIETFFEKPNSEYPEQDILLTSRAIASGRVVCTSYIGDTKNSAGPTVAFPFYENVKWTASTGAQIQLPFDSLLHASAGIGHTNIILGSPSQVPVLIAVGGRAVPAFPLDVLRVARGAARSDVRSDGGVVTVPSEGKLIRIPFGSDGTTTLNFVGDLSAFAHYRCVEVLQSEELQSMLRNKIVLISIIGEGRSRFFPTPYDPQFPSIGIDATFLDNALENRFLTRVDPFIGFLLIPLALNLLLVYLVHRFGYFRGGVFGLLLALLYLSSTQLAFVSIHLVFPILTPLIFLAVAWLGPVLYDYFAVGKHVAQLEFDKKQVEGKLRESELKLQMLERELLDQKTSPRGSELIEEIKRYKQEIKSLSAQVSDMVKFEGEETEPRAEIAHFEGIIYHTGGKMKEVVDLIQKISASDANVLVLGESGTGKELVAHALHSLSSRRGKVFVAVNCGALTETLLESELFGHERGSFTGAIKDKVGRFEYANGGTIFLDEIAETSEAFQVKLLRVVQSGEFERVGSAVTKTIDARIIAATNKNVRELVNERRFREDLFYRLNVFSIELPPLRERKGDIPLLADHFLRREEGSLSFSSTVMDAFLQYRWSGNVRELQSAITRAGILARSDGRTLIQLRDLPEGIAAATKGQIDIEDQILEILRSKKFSRSSISETAESLGGLNRGTVAEYFRGICFKHFFENSWDEANAVSAVAKSEDAESRERVQKKLREYLTNVVDGLTPGQDYEAVSASLRPKYKNLPQRYHTILDEVIRSFLMGKWR